MKQFKNASKTKVTETENQEVRTWLLCKRFSFHCMEALQQQSPVPG